MRFWKSISEGSLPAHQINTLYYIYDEFILYNTSNIIIELDSHYPAAGMPDRAGLRGTPRLPKRSERTWRLHEKTSAHGSFICRAPVQIIGRPIFRQLANGRGVGVKRSGRFLLDPFREEAGFAIGPARRGRGRFADRMQQILAAIRTNLRQRGRRTEGRRQPGPYMRPKQPFLILLKLQGVNLTKRVDEHQKKSCFFFERLQTTSHIKELLPAVRAHP